MIQVIGTKKPVLLRTDEVFLGLEKSIIGIQINGCPVCTGRIAKEQRRRRRDVFSQCQRLIQSLARVCRSTFLHLFLSNSTLESMLLGGGQCESSRRHLRGRSYFLRGHIRLWSLVLNVVLLLDLLLGLAVGLVVGLAVGFGVCGSRGRVVRKGDSKPTMNNQTYLLCRQPRSQGALPRYPTG